MDSWSLFILQWGRVLKQLNNSVLLLYHMIKNMQALAVSYVIKHWTSIFNNYWKLTTTTGIPASLIPLYSYFKRDIFITWELKNET